MTEEQNAEEQPFNEIVTEELVRQKLFESATFVKIIEGKLLDGKLKECAEYQKLLTANIAFLAPLADGQPSAPGNTIPEEQCNTDSELSSRFSP